MVSYVLCDDAVRQLIKYLTKILPGPGPRALIRNGRGKKLSPRALAHTLDGGAMAEALPEIEVTAMAKEEAEQKHKVSQWSTWGCGVSTFDCTSCRNRTLAGAGSKVLGRCVCQLSADCAALIQGNTAARKRPTS